MGTFQKLPTDLIKNGCKYTQVLRGERSCVYEQMFPESRVKYYEVFRIRLRLRRKVFGRVYPPGEIFPNDEAFGKWAWTYKTAEGALNKFNELEKSDND